MEVIKFCRLYSLLRLLRSLECDVHRLGVGIAWVRFVAMLHVAILWEQGLDGVEASMQGEPTDENPWSAVRSDITYHFLLQNIVIYSKANIDWLNL